MINLSKKEKDIKTNAIRIVSAAKIPCRLHTYDAPDGFLNGVSVAEQTGENPDTVFKTLVLIGRSRQHYVCVIPVACELDLKKAAAHFGEKHVEMIENPDTVFKTLVLIGRSRQHYVCVIPVACELDLKKAAAHFGEKHVEMIHAKDITAVTGYIKGGCSPVGMKKQFPTAIHKSAEELPDFWVSGGKVGLQMNLSPAALSELIGASFADLIKE